DHRVRCDATASHPVEAAVAVIKGSRALEVTGFENGVADAADALRAGALHCSVRHPVRRPELELVLIGILEVDSGARLAFGGSARRRRVGYPQFVESADVLLYFFRANVMAVARQSL